MDPDERESTKTLNTIYDSIDPFSTFSIIENRK